MQVQPFSKKIIFVSYGDSTSASSWSNIPYFFSKTLEQKGFELIRINLQPSRKHMIFWEKYINRYLYDFFPGQKYSYIRSPFFKNFVNKKLKREAKKHKDAYFFIFLNFEFYNKFNNIPSLLFGDWTYDMIIVDREKRMPYFFEKWFIEYQRKAIQKSEIVISLFKDSRDIIAERYRKDVKHLGINVINDLNLNPLEGSDILKIKEKSMQILFIGTIKYIESAKKLVKAFIILQQKNPSLELNLVGISLNDLEQDLQVKNLNCFGYLKKDEPADNKIYYDLMVNAKVLVNPADEWAAYSSSVEAMKYYTPIIIKPYPAFVKDFGQNNDFGHFLENTEIDPIVTAIENLFASSEYIQNCKNAHDKVKDFTWDSFTDKIIKLMSEIKPL